jgi:hypothetical protein
MIGSAASWLLTAVFAAAAGATRLPRRPAGASGADRGGAGFCLVMCVALLAMIWWAEPAAVTWLQVAGFGAAAFWFALANGRGRSPLRGRGPLRGPTLTGSHHALMAAAMIWMLTALSGMTRPVPVLAVSAVLTAGCAAASIPWLVRAAGAGPGRRDPAAAGQAAMSAGMAAMLIVML